MPTTYAIIKGNQYMDATTYSGAGGNSTVTNSGLFQPDLVWVKSRTDTGSHVLQDSVRGFTSATKLSSNSTNAENNASGDATDPIYGWVTNVTSSGFSVYAGTTPSQVNKSGQNYVSWQWKAAGANTTNTTGTITSTVSANTTAGFSIVTYTGTTANATVGHGLSVAPSMLIIKSRSRAGDAWVVWPSSFVTAGSTDYLVLSGTETKGAAGAINLWADTAPTSSVFSVGTQGSSNGIAGATYVAYCWSAVPGFSAFGSYAGNNSSDGPFIYTGFRPKFVMIKNYAGASGQDWIILDSSRSPYNVEQARLKPNSGAAEASGDGYDYIDALSNGFKLRGQSGSNGTNGSGYSYIYMAFAETPFKYANAR